MSNVTRRSFHPHVSREEGGHLVVFPKRTVAECYELTQEEAWDLMKTTMLLGYAMTEVMARHGVILRTINYKDNGNWAFLRGEDKPTLHVHLYGRADATANQTSGEALYFPDPFDNPEFYDRNAPISQAEISEIIEIFSRLENEVEFPL